MLFKLEKNIPIEIKNNFYVNLIIQGNGNTDIPEQNEIFQNIQRLNSKNVLEKETIDWFSHITKISRYQAFVNDGTPLITSSFVSNSNLLIILPNEISVTDNPLFFKKQYQFDAINQIKSMVDDKYDVVKILEKIKELQNYPDYCFLIKKQLENDSYGFYYQSVDNSHIPYYYHNDTLYDYINPNTLQKLYDLQSIYDEDDKYNENYVHNSDEIIAKYIQNLYKENNINIDVNIKQLTDKVVGRKFDNVYEIYYITTGQPLESYIELNKEDLNQAIEQYIDKIEEKMEKKQSFKP